MRKAKQRAGGEMGLDKLTPLRLTEKALRYIKMNNINHIKVFQFVLNTIERNINWFNKKASQKRFLMYQKEYIGSHRNEL